jgi:hypothetical protein
MQDVLSLSSIICVQDIINCSNLLLEGCEGMKTKKRTGENINAKVLRVFHVLALIFHSSVTSEFVELC